MVVSLEIRSQIILGHTHYLSPAPQAVPQAAGLSPAPHAVDGAAVFSFQSAIFERAIVITSFIDSASDYSL